ncbi:MAG: disulfide bond formation protein B [Candidatus Nanohaloarchaea archaeon]
MLATLTLLADIGIVASILYMISRRLGRSLEPVEGRLIPFLTERYREVSLLIASTATAGSLYMSNVLGWTPCRLCWFQRIIIYPLVVLFAVAFLLDRDDVRDYAAPLAMIGLPIAFYHALMQRVDQFQSAGCSVLSVSCSTKYTFFYGYVTVPVMATTALMAVLLLLWMASDLEMPSDLFS